MLNESQRNLKGILKDSQGFSRRLWAESRPSGGGQARDFGPSLASGGAARARLWSESRPRERGGKGETLGRVLHTSIAWLSATGGGGAAGHRKRAPARRANRRMVNRRQEDYFWNHSDNHEVYFQTSREDSYVGSCRRSNSPNSACTKGS